MSGALASASATVSATSQSSAAATAQRPRLSGDFNTFLTLLTTQLQNQSPTDPLDTNQMTSQLVQFASVEQQIAMNQNLERLVGLQQVAQLTAAAPLIGQVVEVASDRLTVQGGTASLRLPAAGAASSARIVVADASGRTLTDQITRLESASSTWQWNGRDIAGRAVADGAYRVTVTGLTATGGAASAPFTVLGRATSADRTDGALNLNLGALSVGFDSLRGLGR